MKCLVDLNILLDVVLDRQPWVEDARKFLDEAADRTVELCISAVTVTTLFYLTERLADSRRAFASVDRACSDFTVIAVGLRQLTAARVMPGPDFEDNVQIACAVEVDASFIVSRDISGFQHSPIQCLDAATALSRIISP